MLLTNDDPNVSSMGKRILSADIVLFFWGKKEKNVNFGSFPFMHVDARCAFYPFVICLRYTHEVYDHYSLVVLQYIARISHLYSSVLLVWIVHSFRFGTSFRLKD